MEYKGLLFTISSAYVQADTGDFLNPVGPTLLVDREQGYFQVFDGFHLNSNLSMK
jgi:hypothetical protein